MEPDPVDRPHNAGAQDGGAYAEGFSWARREGIGEVVDVLQTILAVRDLPAAAAFYASLPGLAVAAPEGGAVRVTGPGGAAFLLAAPGADLSAWAGAPRSGPGAWVYLNRPDLPALAAAIGGEPVESSPGFRMLQVADPDGYVVTFWESLPLSDEQILSIYRSVPDQLQAAVAGLTEADLDRPRAPGKWTLREIVHHVVDSDLSTFQVIRMALALPGRQIQADLWTPAEWMAGLQSARRPVGPAVALFGAAHAWVLEALGALPDGLDRWVSWPSGYRADVRQLLRQVGGHALHHLEQLCGRDVRWK